MENVTVRAILKPLQEYARLLDPLIEGDRALYRQMCGLTQAANLARQALLAMQARLKRERAAHSAIQLRPIVKRVTELIKECIPTGLRIRENLGYDDLRVVASEPLLHQIVMSLCLSACSSLRLTGGVINVALTTQAATTIDQTIKPKRKREQYAALSIAVRADNASRPRDHIARDKAPTLNGLAEVPVPGLDAVHDLICDLGGEMTVHDHDTFDFTLDVWLPPAGVTEEHEWIEHFEIPEGQERVLFVDDDKLVTMMWQEYLEQLGYEVTVFNDSLEAFGELTRHAPEYDIVIVDHLMPGMTGGELARVSRRLRPDLPVIVISGHPRAIVAGDYDLSGIREFVTKPFTIHELSDAMRRALLPMAAPNDAPMMPLPSRSALARARL